jgi:type II secretion system protein I
MPRPHNVRRPPGFTLVEVIVAVSILSIGLVVVLRYFLHITSAANILEIQTEAVLFAESKMQQVAVARMERAGEPVAYPENGTARFNNRDIRWTVESSPVDVGTVDPGQEPSRVERLTITMAWKVDGREQGQSFAGYFRVKKNAQ